jgi:hypothetical protein
MTSIVPVAFGTNQNTTKSIIVWKVFVLTSRLSPADIHKVSAGMKGKKMKVKLQDVLYTPGTHTVEGITLKVSADKHVKAYLDGELFLFTPGGMSIATRNVSASAKRIRLKNALNKVFKAIDFPVVWTVEDGTIAFTCEGQAFTSNQELVPGTTYDYHTSCNFHWWQMESKAVNEFLYQELKAERYL